MGKTKSIIFHTDGKKISPNISLNNDKKSNENSLLSYIQLYRTFSFQLFAKGKPSL